MNVQQFVTSLQDASWPDETVWAQDEEGKVYRISRVERESVTDDGEGHATSTGGTVWIKLEAY